VSLPSRQQLNRGLVAILAVGCLLAGAWLSLTGEPGDNNHFLGGSFVRSGLLLGAFWLGMPTRGRAAAWANVSPWVTLGVIAAVILLIRRPQILIPIIGAFGFLLYVMPIMTRLLGAERPNPPKH
jgi:hypothetical protein